eukprot:gene5509-biopygen8100
MGICQLTPRPQRSSAKRQRACTSGASFLASAPSCLAAADASRAIPSRGAARRSGSCRPRIPDSSWPLLPATLGNSNNSWHSRQLPASSWFPAIPTLGIHAQTNAWDARTG